MDKPDFEKVAQQFSEKYWATDQSLYEMLIPALEEFYNTYVSPSSSTSTEKLRVGNDGFGFDENSTYKKSEVFNESTSTVKETEDNLFDRALEVYNGLPECFLKEMMGEYFNNPARKGASVQVNSLSECKDEVARKHNLHSWDNACYVWAGFVKQMEPFMDEAAELYASQFKKGN